MSTRDYPTLHNKVKEQDFYYCSAFTSHIHRFRNVIPQWNEIVIGQSNLMATLTMFSAIHDAAFW
jgi:hypothetical protein